MKVFLLKDVERVGIAGEIIKTSEGYARNFLIPQKLALEVTPQNESSFANKVKTIEHRKEVVESKTSMLAEKIKSIELVLKRKMHDGDKLYGSISASDIVDLLAAKGVSVSKNQVEFGKAIKTKGIYEVVIKLSSKLQPTLKLKIMPESQGPRA
ncbi:50S ribosomal protein L9 [Candidatus Dependentiae bacterium]|nr:50S ribosomal protein L9 [Candidatus Dependentiae bacterium]